MSLDKAIADDQILICIRKSDTVNAENLQNSAEKTQIL
jgi:hypothetical protein